jgi:hypothetical protein
MIQANLGGQLKPNAILNESLNQPKDPLNKQPELATMPISGADFQPPELCRSGLQVPYRTDVWAGFYDPTPQCQ